MKMKNVVLLLSSLFVIIYISSCNKDPEFTISFEASAEMVNVGQAINFTNTSTDNVSDYSWDFGDGTTSTEENPTHTYSSMGTYTVELTGSIEDNSKSSKKTIKIADVQPTASFSLPSLLQTKCPITFQNTSVNAAEYAWDFGDGNVSTLQSPTHTYTTAGTYNITLITKNGTLEAEEDKSVIIIEGTGQEIIPETESTIAFDALPLDDGYIIGTVVNDKTKLYRKDNVGNTVWTKIISSGKDYKLAQMEMLPNGNIALAATYSTTSGNTDFGWMIINQDGNLISDGENSFAGEQTVSGLLIQSDGAMVIYGQDIFNSNKSGYVICVDSETGIVKWTRLYEFATEDEINTGVSNSDGTFILGGTRFDAGTSSNPRSLLLKYDQDGNLLWDKTGQILSQPRIRAMVRIDDNSINIVGNSAISVINNDGNPSFTKNFSISAGGSFSFLSADKVGNSILATGYVITSNSPLIIEPLVVSFDKQGDLEYFRVYMTGGSFDFLLASVDYNTCNNILVGYSNKNGKNNPLILRVDKQGDL